MLQFLRLQGREENESFSVPYNPFLLIVRCSDAANFRAKVSYPKGKEIIFKAFNGVRRVFNAEKLDDLDYTRYKEEMG